MLSGEHKIVPGAHQILRKRGKTELLNLSAKVFPTGEKKTLKKNLLLARQNVQRSVYANPVTNHKLGSQSLPVFHFLIIVR